MFKRAHVRKQSDKPPEETMSVLFRAPRSIAQKGFALMGVIATTLLVGASANPSSTASSVAPGRQASGVIVADGPTRPVPRQAQRTTQDDETVRIKRGGELEQGSGHPSTATTGSAAQFRLKEERDRLVLRFTDQLVYLESVFADATPGSPAQFRAHEEVESLREQLRSIAPR